MHQIAPFLSFFFVGERAPDPPSTSVGPHGRRVQMGGGGVWYSLFVKNLAHYSSH